MDKWEIPLYKKYIDAKKECEKAEKILDDYIKKLLKIYCEFKRTKYRYNFKEEYILREYDTFKNIDTYYTCYGLIMIEIFTHEDDNSTYFIKFPIILFDGTILTDEQITEILMNYILETDEDVKRSLKKMQLIY